MALDDGEIPFVYYFVIFATAEGGNTRWINGLSTDTNCPTSVPLTTASFTNPKNTWIGATGTDAFYTFPEFMSTLPKCQYVTGYTVTESGGGSRVTYPSARCLANPCLFIDIDVSAVADIYISIRAHTTLDTSSTDNSGSLLIRIALDANTPTIIATDLSTYDTSFFLSSVANFQFNKFISSDEIEYPATSYSVDGCTSSLVAPPSCQTSSITKDTGTGMM